MDNFTAGIIGCVVGVLFLALLIGAVKCTHNSYLQDVSIQCGKLGYDKAFLSNDVYYCGNELERIKNDTEN